MSDHDRLTFALGAPDSNLRLHQFVDPLEVQGDGQDLDGLRLQYPVAGSDSMPVLPITIVVPSATLPQRDRVLNLDSDGVQPLSRRPGATDWPRGISPATLDPGLSSRY